MQSDGGSSMLASTAPKSIQVVLTPVGASPGGGSSAGMWVFVGLVVVAIVTIVLVGTCSPANGRGRRKHGGRGGARWSHTGTGLPSTTTTTAAGTETGTVTGTLTGTAAGSLAQQLWNTQQARQAPRTPPPPPLPPSGACPSAGNAPPAVPPAFVINTTDSKHPKALDDVTFHELVASGQPGIVLVFGSWCGWSKKILPDYMTAAKESDGTYPFYVLEDKTTKPETLQAYNIRGFPTILKVRGGSVETYTGDRSAASILEYAKH